MIGPSIAFYVLDANVVLSIRRRATTALGVRRRAPANHVMLPQ